MAGAGGSRLLVPPVYFGAALLLMALLHRFAPAAQLIFAPYRYAGFAFIAAGIALAIWAALLFRRAGTAIHPFHPSSALVTGGPYRFSRNPMYLGMALILLGTALFLGSLTPFVVLPAFVALITDRFVRDEETRLRAAFGDAFLEYQRRVRRWL